MYNSFLATVTLCNIDMACDQIPSDHALSGPRMNRFISDFTALSVRSNMPRKDVPVLHKVRWAIHDKDKFENLIQQLSYFISKLDQIIPDTIGSLQSMTTEDLKRLRLGQLQVVLEASCGREALIADIAKNASNKNYTSRILNCLWYRLIDDRRLTIHLAHKNTLNWILQPHEKDTGYMWDNLYSWLRHDSGIYWVSGKAGSGKSTLMKYLYEHEEIKRLLGLWAEGSPLTIVNFFLYALGSYEQNSQEGLEKALLYQILKAVPSLVPTLLPNMWQQALLAEDAKLSLPSHGEFKTAIETIGNGLNSPLKFCFFIDGLDEYSGNCWEGISTIKALTRNPNVKIVVLSRPIPGCVQSLSGFPKLQLQDLIRQDISNYIEDILGSHQYVKRLDILQPGFFVRMCHELTSKASGVFLWIVLACRSLISGFAAHDNHSELLERIDQLPKELEDLFQLMLKKIEPRYRTPAAKALLVCHRNQLHNSRDIPSICLSILEEVSFHPCTVSEPAHLSEQMKRDKCEALEGRLRSRCCGLLEIQTHIGDCFFCKGNRIPDCNHDIIFDSVVVFMHRTVYDFLSQSGVWELDCLQIHDPTFELFTILSCIELLRL